MKKPLLATLGVAGACAACCAIPLAVPLLGGLSVAGLVALDWTGLVSVAAAPVGAAIAATLLAGGALWWHKRRKATASCAAPAHGAAPASCGCASRQAT